LAQRIADHADSRTIELYDRRGQKVLLEDMERIRYWNANRYPMKGRSADAQPYEQEEEAYAEALRRIRETENTGATWIDLSDIEFLHQLPQAPERLKSLLTVNLPAEWLTEVSPLAGLTSLQTLELSRCGLITDLSPLAGLMLLQTLELSGRELITDLSPLAGLTLLQTLDLSSCERLTDLSPLAGLTSLQSLNLSRCVQLTDLSPLAGLTSLQTLDLSSCERLTDLSPLAGLTSLQSLDLSMTVDSRISGGSLLNRRRSVIGPSGRFGFGTPGVRDRFHDFGRGGFFQEKFVRDFWLPWFRNAEFVKSKAPQPFGGALASTDGHPT
jgi:Leucine Rich repeats (2 copies)